MKINVGSNNKVKVDALKELTQDYSILNDADISPVSVKSNVSEQPKTMAETIQGAINRARNAFDNCSLSFGIEGGITQIPNTKSGYMNFCACAIFDGNEIHLGISSGFEIPKQIVNHIFEKDSCLGKAYNELGLSKKYDLGSDEGAVGLHTKVRVNRKEYTKQAIIMALIHLDN